MWKRGWKQKPPLFPHAIPPLPSQNVHRRMRDPDYARVCAPGLSRSPRSTIGANKPQKGLCRGVRDEVALSESFDFVDQFHRAGDIREGDTGSPSVSPSRISPFLRCLKLVRPVCWPASIYLRHVRRVHSYPASIKVHLNTPPLLVR